VCEDGRLAEIPDTNCGPWDVIAEVKGEPPFYNKWYKVRVRFSPEYPRSEPDVKFLDILHHAFIDDNMVPPEALASFCREGFSVSDVLATCQLFLQSPESMQITEPRIQQAFAAVGKQNAQRLTVLKSYVPKHPELHENRFEEAWLDPAFLAAHRAGTKEAWRAAAEEHLAERVFSIPVVTDEFRKMMIEEIFNFYESGLPARRPNSMNAYGIILNEIGLEGLIQDLQQRYLAPMFKHFFSPAIAESLDGNHCFIVRYRAGEDLGLDMHTDDSDITFNLALGLDFEGAKLQFCGMMGSTDHRQESINYSHVRGRAVIHYGKHRHGADDITSGERLNMILWNHSSAFRASDESKTAYVKETAAPSAVCVSYTHDRDYALYQQYPEGKEDFFGRGWCPPRSMEYPGFKSEVEAARSGLVEAPL
jgi:ubiquitin-protein ligase